MREYVVEGTLFNTLEEFAAHFSKRLLLDHEWNGNLDALNDILRGGFGTPDGGFVLVWKDAELSRQRLGHEEAAAVLARRLATCHPTNRLLVSAQLAAARRGLGPTVFDWLLEILHDHGPGGSEPEDGVEVRLE